MQQPSGKGAMAVEASFNIDECIISFSKFEEVKTDMRRGVTAAR